MTRRILAIGLDGYEPTVARPLLERGALPNLARLAARSARFALDQTSPVRPGLVWEYFASGQTPDSHGKWTAVHFDPKSYRVWQDGCTLPPFLAKLAARTVVVDTPFVDLARAPNVRGIVGWGCHDPGLELQSAPAGLEDEVRARFGGGAPDWALYGMSWPSADITVRLGQRLAAGVAEHAALARWMLGERLPDWDLGYVVSTELHSAHEAFWYGLDREHPLHSRAASTAAAGRALVEVWRTVDRLVGDLGDAFPDALLLVFALQGMGPNHSDAASMVLLPELLHRHAFGTPWLRGSAPADAEPKLPMLDIERHWAHVMNEQVPRPQGFRSFQVPPGSRLQSIDWIPATRYQPFWPRMPAFALPTFDDGRVRINLAGREAQGIVPPERYAETCAEVEALVRACRDPVFGRPAVRDVVRHVVDDPRHLGPAHADLTILWAGPNPALDHPRHGRMGPLPYRRPGGHTRRHGMAWLSGDGIAPGDRGPALFCDVAPTIVDLLGEPPIEGMDGTSLLARLRSGTLPDRLPTAAS